MQASEKADKTHIPLRDGKCMGLNPVTGSCEAAKLVPSLGSDTYLGFEGLDALDELLVSDLELLLMLGMERDLATEVLRGDKRRG